MTDGLAVSFTCMGSYSSEDEQCNGLVTGTVKECRMNGNICDRLSYLRAFGEGNGTLNRGYFQGNLTYKQDIDGDNELQVTCRGKFNGIRCEGTAELGISIDGMTGKGLCLKGMDGKYCMGELTMYYGHNELFEADATDESVDGKAVSCKGVYSFVDSVCSKEFQRVICLGDFSSDENKWFCIGRTEQLNCQRYLGNNDCSKNSTSICNSFFMDKKCLKVKRSITPECNGYYTGDNVENKVCYGIYQVPAKQGYTCEGDFSVAIELCNGKLTTPNRKCTGKSVLGQVCEGTYHSGDDTSHYECIGNFRWSDNTCRGSQKYFLFKQVYGICQGLSTMTVLDSCDGRYIRLARLDSLALNGYRGSYIMSDVKTQDKVKCEGIVRIYEPSDQLFCVGKIDITSEKLHSFPAVSCEIWDRTACIPEEDATQKLPSTLFIPQVLVEDKSFSLDLSIKVKIFEESSGSLNQSSNSNSTLSKGKTSANVTTNQLGKLTNLLKKKTQPKLKPEDKVGKKSEPKGKQAPLKLPGLNN